LTHKGKGRNRGGKPREVQWQADLVERNYDMVREAKEEGEQSGKQRLGVKEKWGNAGTGTWAKVILRDICCVGFRGTQKRQVPGNMQTLRE